MNTLKKVVESVTDNKKQTKIKKKTKRRELNKPNGCSWGLRCKFDHEEVIQLEKKVDCSYWMDGHCRFEDKTCWNIHDPEKKGEKT